MHSLFLFLFFVYLASPRPAFFHPLIQHLPKIMGKVNITRITFFDVSSKPHRGIQGKISYGGHINYIISVIKNFASFI